MEKKILYGASVQGIQGFIFQTNKLKDISGASELVEEICTTSFARAIYPIEETVNLTDKSLKEKLAGNDQVLLNAAGNIKYIPRTHKECATLVREFPKLVQLKAPGITVSQAVVEYIDEDDNSFSEAVIQLESRLRIQRNKPMRSNTLGLMGILRSRNTGLPALVADGDDYLDAATMAKKYVSYEPKKKRETINLCKKALFNGIQEWQVPYNIDEITGENGWIAVIHADGNGLGQIVQRIGHNAQRFKTFSKELDHATITAANRAFAMIDEKYSWDNIVPIRPVVLGGDDLTVICRGDLALDYVKYFIENFELETSKMDCFKEEHEPVFTEGKVRDRLTACAGIAYVKSSYPFYYAYELAEALCTEAKKDAKDKVSIRDGKELPASCIMFHKLQDSFMEDYEELRNRELEPGHGISFVHGPYYLNQEAAAEHGKWTIERLQHESDEIGKNNAVRAHLRNWMSSVFDNSALGVQQMDRLMKRHSEKEILVQKIKEWTSKEDNKEDGKKLYSPVYDILALHTLQNQKTK